MKPEEQHDLFENLHLVPDNVLAVLETFDENGNEYTELARLAKECEALGYTFDYYLTAEPFNLRKLSTRTVIYGVNYNFEVTHIAKIINNTKDAAELIIDEMYDKGLPNDDNTENYDCITFDNNADCMRWIKKHHLSTVLTLTILIAAEK
ncbi:MAG: hypothetical protein MI743_19370 [Sneathiellales bacterium]|nr:hypothetical protein [Sneathiellales bacterium]